MGVASSWGWSDVPGGGALGKGWAVFPKGAWFMGARFLPRGVVSAKNASKGVGSEAGPEPGRPPLEAGSSGGGAR